MCLAVPGRVLTTAEDAHGMRVGRVSFAGVVKDVSLAFLPEAAPGDYVLVHAGVAITRVDEEEAAATLALLHELGQVEDAP